MAKKSSIENNNRRRRLTKKHSGRRARLRAIARILKGGRTIALLACDVFDQKGSLVAHATSTVMMLSGDAANGR